MQATFTTFPVEKANLEDPQIFQIGILKNKISAEYGQSVSGGRFKW